ncbi:phosphotransferase [Mesoplasma photuris]|uniref:phosphotransferase n=1 Tax=Mesoplasma photuris TaxID=217731 RepID=UPI0004E1246C|nr:phosphotransferase [Mesoplasma photuris]
MENKGFNGLTNFLWLENGYLYKKSNQTVDYFLDRNNEIKFYEQINKLNQTLFYTPTWYEFDNDNHFVSRTKYIPNAKTFHDVFICKNKMKVVKKIIDQFHQLDLDIKLFDPKKILDKFKTKIDAPLFDISQFDQEIESIINSYYTNAKIVVSHNDLVQGNFLKTDKCWVLIDFEFTMKNHYLFDYASFMSESLSMHKWDKFLSLLNLDEFETAKLYDLIKYQNYLWSYWASYMYQLTNENIYLEIAQDKYNKLIGGNHA